MGTEDDIAFILFLIDRHREQFLDQVRREAFEEATGEEFIRNLYDCLTVFLDFLFVFVEENVQILFKFHVTEAVEVKGDPP